MATNYVQPGKILTTTNGSGSDVASGGVIVCGAGIRIAVKAIADGESGEAYAEGVFTLDATAADSWSDGDVLYWDTSTNKLTDVANANCVGAGHAVGDKASSATSAKVKLLPVETGVGEIDTTDILDEAVTLAKMADLTRGSIISGQTADNRPTALDAKGDGKILIGDGTDLASVAVSGDITITNAGVTTLNAAHAYQRAIIHVEDLAADADIANRPIFVAPDAGVTLVSIGILTEGAPAGVDDSNTSVIALKDDAGNTIVTKTYNTATQPPSSDYEDLGTLDGTHKVLSAGEHVTLSVTNGTTADLPAFSVILVYEPTNA